MNAHNLVTTRIIIPSSFLPFTLETWQNSLNPAPKTLKTLNSYGPKTPKALKPPVSALKTAKAQSTESQGLSGCK